MLFGNHCSISALLRAHLRLYTMYCIVLKNNIVTLLYSRHGRIKNTHTHTHTRRDLHNPLDSEDVAESYIAFLRHPDVSWVVKTSPRLMNFNQCTNVCTIQQNPSPISSKKKQINSSDAFSLLYFVIMSLMAAEMYVMAVLFLYHMHVEYNRKERRSEQMYFYGLTVLLHVVVAVFFFLTKFAQREAHARCATQFSRHLLRNAIILSTQALML